MLCLRFIFQQYHRSAKKASLLCAAAPLAAGLIAGLLAACASGPSASSAPPDWAARGVEAVYPEAAYIAQEGRGPTKAAASAEALAAISRYFTSEVSSTTRSASAYTSGGGNSARVETDNFVRSNTSLFAVRYAAPWYDAREKEYAVVAYLGREEAWAVFEPRVLREAEGFRALWRQAENESAALKILFAYKALQNYAGQAEYVNTMKFGEALYPAKMNALVRDVRERGAQLAAKINEARNMSSIFIDCPEDVDSNIAGTLTRLLSGEGLIVAKTKAAAQTVCSVTVDEGYQKLAAGHFYTPRVTVVMSDRQGEPLFSYDAGADRVGRPGLDIARRYAYRELAAALERGFIEGFNRTFEAKRP